MAERGEQVAGRHPDEDRRDGQHEEPEGDRGRGREKRGEDRPHGRFGKPKPALPSRRRPRFESSFRTNVAAATGCLVALTTASSYRIGG